MGYLIFASIADMNFALTTAMISFPSYLVPPIDFGSPCLPAAVVP